MDPNVIGSYVAIVTKDDDCYEGYVNSVIVKQQLLILQKVKNSVDGSYQKGLFRIYGDQIKDLKIIPGIEKVYPSNDTNALNIVKKTHSLKENEKMHNFKDASDKGPALLNHPQSIDPEFYLGGIENYNVNYNNALNKPPSLTFINSLNKDFNEAISFIQSQHVVSLSVEGRTVSRFGHITLVIIGTREMIYIFDIEICQHEFFVGGLKDMLEDVSLLKVVHDVRMMSDCLFNVYQVKLTCVFDTQVAEAVIHRQLYDKLPSKVSSLTSCLIRHLNIHPKQCTFENTKKVDIKCNSNIWMDRPFNSDFLKACAKSVMYLRELRTAMMRKLLAECLYGVDIYLDCVRNKADNAVKYEVNPNRLPKEFEQILTVTQNRKQRHMYKQKKAGIIELEIDSQDDSGSDERTSNRSGWDDGSEFATKYKERFGEIVECIDKKGPSLIKSSKPLLKTFAETKQSFSPKKTEQTYQQEKSLSPALKPKQTPILKNKHSNKTFVETNFDEISAASNESDEFNHNLFQNLSYASLLTNSKQVVPTAQQFPPLIKSQALFDESLYATTSDSDDGIYLSSVNDNHSKTPTYFQSPFVSDSKEKRKCTPELNLDQQNRPKVGEEGKRLISNLIRPCSGMEKQPATVVDLIDTSDTPDTPFKKNYNPIENVSPRYQQVKTFGRGQLLKKQFECSKSPGASRIPSKTPISPPGIGTSRAYEFPSDDELLDTPPVAKMVYGKEIGGEDVSVLRKF